MLSTNHVPAQIEQIGNHSMSTQEPEKHINSSALLIHSPPEIVLLAIDLNGPAHRRWLLPRA
jgi:hypothetical protein